MVLIIYLVEIRGGRLMDMRTWMLWVVLIGCTDPAPVPLGPGQFRVVDGTSTDDILGYSIAGPIDGGVGIGFMPDNTSADRVYCSDVARTGWTTITLTDHALARGTVAISETLDPVVASASIDAFYVSDETGTVELTEVGDAIVGSLHATGVSEKWGPVTVEATFDARCWR